jgi:hypothetical protein
MRLNLVAVTTHSVRYQRFSMHYWVWGMSYSAHFLESCCSRAGRPNVPGVGLSPILIVHVEFWTASLELPSAPVHMLNWPDISWCPVLLFGVPLLSSACWLLSSDQTQGTLMHAMGAILLAPHLSHLICSPQSARVLLHPVLDHGHPGNAVRAPPAAVPLRPQACPPAGPGRLPRPRAAGHHRRADCHRQRLHHCHRS